MSTKEIKRLAIEEITEHIGRPLCASEENQVEVSCTCVANFFPHQPGDYIAHNVARSFLDRIAMTGDRHGCKTH